MSPTDRQALADVYELAQLLSSISEIKKNMEEANLKIGFVKRKMEEREKKNYYCPLNHNYLLPTR